MADPSQQPEDPAGGFGDAGFSQEDIDALLQASSADSSADAQEVAGEDANASDRGEDAFDQGDIDALINAADGGGEASASDAVGEESKTPNGAEASAEEADTRVDSLGRPFDDAAAAMQAAIEEEAAAKAASSSAPSGSAAPSPPVQHVALEDLGEGGAGEVRHRITMLNDVDLNVRIQLGQTRMLVEDVLKLDAGSVVELDKLAGDPVDVYVNDRLVARGEVLVLNDNFCVRISDVLSRDPHRVVT